MTDRSTEKISFVIVIPCYNEENRLPISDYERFIELHDDVLVCFVNDGSTDKTAEILELLGRKFDAQIAILDLSENSGKAEAVRQGMTYCNTHFQHQRIAFLDADLATSLEECKTLSKNISGDVNFVFGSRKKMASNTIERNYLRHVIGRLVAASISKVLKLDIHDTQCGCKIFTKRLSQKLFKEPFISKWLFDVELFQRMKLLYGNEHTKMRIKEITLKKWVDKGASKVKATYIFKLWGDLYKINRWYKTKAKLNIAQS